MLRFASLQDIRLDYDGDRCCCRGQGTIDGIDLAYGDVVVITDHPHRPAFGVLVALGDSAIVERVYLTPKRSIVPDYPPL